MFSKFSFLGLVITTTFLAWSCNDNTSNTANQGNDSATSQSSNAAHDTSQSMANESTTGNAAYTASMNSMMERMKNVKMTGDFDVDFANMMIEHHQGGIDMAQIEVTQGRDEKLKAKAQEILTKQKDEQRKLRDFASSYKPSGMKHGEGELQTNMNEMMSMMQSMKMSGDVDKDFATMMMHHHEHGIAMAKMEVKHGMSDELKKMAQKSIDDQQKDNKELQAWLSGK